MSRTGLNYTGTRTAAACEIIAPRKRAEAFNVAEVIAYRELLYFLVWRDVKVRYKQTLLGAVWVILQPVFSMVVYSAVFGNFIRMPSSAIPYSLFVIVGIVPWSFFSNTVSDSGNILLHNIHLIKKIYFPRILLPLARVLTSLLDFGITLTVLGLFLLYYKVTLTWNVLLLPLLVLATIAASVGVCALLSSLNAQYRDIHFVIPYAVQIWMFCSPVIYPMEQIPDYYRWILSLNPMVGIIEGYRSGLLGTEIHWQSLTYSLAAITGVLILGLQYFRRVERKLADIA